MQCRVCRSDKLVTVLEMGDQYFSEFRDEGLPDKAPVNMVMCQKCTLVQLRETPPQDKLYTDNYGYYSGINNTIKADLLDIVTKSLDMVKPQAGDTVIDIGSNDGTLLKNYPKNLKRIGFDPIPKFAEFYNEENLTFVNDFFNKEAYEGGKPKIITAISCFYDLDNPHTFVQDVADILHPEGLFVIEQNYLARMIENLAFDNIVHEHIEYYTLRSLEYLLDMHSLKVVKVEVNSINGGAFRTYVRHMDGVERMRKAEEMQGLDDLATYETFGKNVNRAVKELYDFVKGEYDKGKIIYLYGASTRGNTLIQIGIQRYIKAAVERNPVKVGKKFLNIPIISEEQARGDKFDYALICPWFFADEIVAREHEIAEKGVKFIIPLPKLRIV